MGSTLTGKGGVSGVERALVKDSIPSDVQSFILDSIGSVEMLTVLILLYDRFDRSWTSSQVAAELRTNEWSADLQLQALTTRQLAVASASAPAEYQAVPQLSTIVAKVARTYRERRVAVITLIYSRPDEAEAESSDPVQAFADAFKLRKDK